jgi:hypothetical protein
MRLHVRRRNRFGSLHHCGVEAERLFDELDIVVDGLRDADHSNLETSALDLLGDGERPLLRAVASNRKQYVEVELFDRIHDLRGPVAASARGAEHGPANLVDVIHDIRIERNNVKPVFRQKALVSIADSGNPANAVEMPQTPHDSTNDIIEPRAQPAAGDDARVDVRGAEIDLLARTRDFEQLIAGARRLPIGL